MERGAPVTERLDGGWRVGIDTGGTFTDLVAVSPDGEFRLVKVRSTPSDPSQACFEALARTGPAGPVDVSALVLGTTIATNALLQRSGAPVVFLTTDGFEDTLFIQRIDRKGPYDLQWTKPVPYVERRNCLGVRERVAADGSVVIELTEGELDRVDSAVGPLLAELPDLGIAISLLFSYVNPLHEERLAARLRRAFPGTPVSVSSEVAPVWREYERGNTTVIDVSVKKTVADFVESLADGFESRSIRGSKALMKSNGGQVQLRHAESRPSHMLFSGLAAGMIAGEYFARMMSSTRAVTLDMGGTSADVGVVVDGTLRISGLTELEWGLPIALPMIDVTTIGAGGSSIAWIDSGGLLRVGPRSAGADPGPASYGRGGDRPTITDANLIIGRLDPAYFLGGELPLYPDEARRALETLETPLGLPLEAVADAVISVAIENMSGAIRLVTVDRGLDYRDFDLVAFGGAGPLHAAEIVRRMGMNRVIVPPRPGLASAYGALIADERIDQRMTLVRRLDSPQAADLGPELARLADAARAELASQSRLGSAEIVVGTAVACRYLGQNYEQEIAIDPGTPDFASKLASRFHAGHRQVYGYAMEDQPLESVSISAAAVAAVEPVAFLPYSGPAGEGSPRWTARDVLVRPGEWAEAAIARRDGLQPGTAIEGPAVIEDPDSTIYVPPGFAATVHETQCLILERAGDS